MGSYTPPARNAIELQYVGSYTAPARNAIVLQYDPGAQAPTVSTQAATSVTAISAIGHGNIIDDGSDPISQHGVCFKLGADPVDIAGADGHTEEGSGAEGTFTSIMISLTGAKRYYYRAYATNSIGTGYGDAVDFLTSLLLSETMSVSAAMNKGIAATQEEVFALADNIDLQKAFVRSLLESIYLSDGDVEQIVYVLHEDMGIADSLRKAMRHMLGDTASLSDNISLGLIKKMVETIPLSSQISISLAMKRQLAESFLLSDKQKAGLSRALTEIMPLASSVSKAAARTLSDTVDLADTLSRQVNFVRALAETLGLADGDAEQLVIKLKETLGLNADHHFALTRTIADILTLSALQVFGHHLQLSETLNMADNIAKAIERLLSDTVAMDDNVKKELVISRVLHEVLSAQDRLRIGGVWDDPTTKIWVAILKAALKVEVF